MPEISKSLGITMKRCRSLNQRFKRKPILKDQIQTYPLQKKYHSPDFLRTIPHLRSRLPINALMARLRSQVVSSSTDYFEKEGFVQTHPPILTSSDCEGAGEVFSVGTTSQQDGGKVENFFKTPKYLTVSSQLHLEALAQSVGKVWTLSPTFRAEQSDTPRHLSEFYMLEAEVAFAEDLHQIMNVVEGLLKSIVNKIDNSQVGEELLSAADGKSNPATSETAVTKEVLQRRWLQFKDGNWPRITYSDAVELLKRAVSDQKARFKFPPTFGGNLQAEHEKYIAETVGNDGAVFITDYPRDLKAFYMSLSPSQSTQTPSLELTVSCFDLVVPELCEIAGGSMREHQLDLLLKSMEDHGLLKDKMTEENKADGEDKGISLSRVPENLQWYVDLRRWGSVPHGGFGLGFDRLLCYLSGVSTVRDMVTFPRWYRRCDC
jgi:asparaginyl-tRNA synthetase